MASPGPEEVWPSPKNLLKERIDFGAFLVIIIERDGKNQKYWFGKKSGNGLFHQRTMRAIKKPESFSPIPKEFNEKTLEIGIFFLPE